MHDSRKLQGGREEAAAAMGLQAASNQSDRTGRGRYPRWSSKMQKPKSHQSNQFPPKKLRKGKKKKKAKQSNAMQCIAKRDFLQKLQKSPALARECPGPPGGRFLQTGWDFGPRGNHPGQCKRIKPGIPSNSRSRECNPWSIPKEMLRGVGGRVLKKIIL